MVQLTETSISIRKQQAVQVYVMAILQGMSVAEACDHVGISPDVYYRWIRESDDAIQFVNTLQKESQLEELHDLELARAKATRLLLEKVNDGLSIAELDTILRNINKRLPELTTEISTASPVEKRASDYLQSPQLRQAESRFSASATVNVRPEPDGSTTVTVMRQDDILDMEFADDQQGDETEE